MRRLTLLPVTASALVALAACSSAPAATTPAAQTSAPSVAASAAAPASQAAQVPPGADKTKITDWTDPRPAAWTTKYPLFAPITTAGDGSLARVQNESKTKICSALGLVPWNYIDPASNKVVGVETEIFAYVKDKLGLPDADYSNVDFQALIPALQSGQCDMIMSSIGIRADRAEQVQFTLPYLLTYDQFIVRKDSPYQTADDMKGKTIGTFAGTADQDVLQAWIDKEGQGAHIATFNTPNECFLATQNSTIDACFTDNVAISAAINGQYSSLRALSQPFDYSAGFPTDAQRDPYKLLSIATATKMGDLDLNRAFSIAIAQMMADGTGQQIFEKWHLWDANQGNLIRPDA
jgi:ABC-type amino acid transport substrate-binding protein